VKYTITVNIGTRLWTHASHDFELGRYRWLWVAKLVAWWHVQKWPHREATITLSEQGNTEVSDR
jgi:hypothetical protein